MAAKRNNLYYFILIACLVGYSWLYVNIAHIFGEKFQCNICIIKKLTNIPCPSCGVTRSVMSLAKANFAEAIYLNPLGIFVAIIMISAPIWICLDLFFRKNTFLQFYKKMEYYFKKPKYFIPFIFLITTNWFWNFWKAM